jgi:hypothetical protein
VGPSHPEDQPVKKPVEMPSQSPPDNSGDAAILAQLRIVMQKLSNRAPSGPVGAKGLKNVKSEHRPAWSVQETDGKLLIWVPKNLESFGDDYLVIAGIEAIIRLEKTETVELLLAEDDSPRLYKEGQSKVSLYFSGMSSALRTDTIATNPNYSGAFGKGYNWIVFKKFEAANVNVAFLSGKPPSPQKIASGSAWGDQLSGSTNRLIALCRRGAATLTIAKPAQWLRSYESFRGKELKKDLRSQRVGILSREEINHLAGRFPGITEAYTSFEEQLKYATIPWMVDLHTHIGQVNRSSAGVEAIANNIIQQRLSSILPQNKKQRERSLKKPMAVLIEELDGEDYINFFNPAMADSKPRFVVDIDRLKVDNVLPLTTKDMLIHQYGEYAKSITDDKYRQYCTSWFEATLASKLGL